MSVVSSVSHGFIHGFWWRWRILVAKTKDFWQRIQIFGKDYGFLVKITDFLAKITDFLAKITDFFFRQCWHCILMREVPALSMCTHTNEGIPSTEHVQMLHWACADMLMRENPVTDWTHYTCRGMTRIHRSPSRLRPSSRPTATLINIYEPLI